MEGFANRPFSYIRHCCDSDIVEGQCCHDKDNEEGDVGTIHPMDVIMRSSKVLIKLCKLLLL